MQLAFTYLTSAQSHRIHEIKQLRSISQLIGIVSNLIHSLQHERGSSNIFLGSKGRKFQKEWVDFRDATNASQGEFIDWISKKQIFKGLAGGSRLLTQLALAVYRLNQLSDIREDITKIGTSINVTTDAYSSAINALLILVFEAADIAVDPSLSKHLVALFHLMQGKEFAGLERATGVQICSLGKQPDLLQTMGNLVELQENCISKFEAFSDEEVLSQWGILVQSMPIIEIEQMRRRLLSPSSLSQVVSVEIWFQKTTARIDDMHIAEKYLTNDLAHKCDELIVKAKAQLNDHAALLQAINNESLQSPVSLLVSNLSHYSSEDKNMGKKIGANLSMAIIDALQLQSKELSDMGQELLSVRATLDERKIIERAKGVLIAHQGITEEQAYVTMRDTAMAQNKKIIDIAKSVLSLSEFLNLKH